MPPDFWICRHKRWRYLDATAEEGESAEDVTDVDEDGPVGVVGECGRNMNAESNQVQDDDDNLDGSEAGPISRRGEFPKQEPGQPDDKDPFVPEGK